MDGRLALSHDAGLTHSHRPQHAVGSQGALQGCPLIRLQNKSSYSVALPSFSPQTKASFQLNKFIFIW